MGDHRPTNALMPERGNSPATFSSEARGAPQIKQLSEPTPLMPERGNSPATFSPEARGAPQIKQLSPRARSNTRLWVARHPHPGDAHCR